MTAASFVLVCALTVAAGMAAAAVWRVMCRISPPDAPIELERFTVGPRETRDVPFTCGCRLPMVVPAGTETALLAVRCPRHRRPVQREEAAA